jgi:hypothetical protein
MRSPSDVYSCSTHGKSSRRFEKNCSLHHIRTEVVRELVLDTKRRVSGYVRVNEDEFARKVHETSATQQDEAAKSHRKRIAKNEKRIAELDMLFRKTYEDNAVGKLSDDRFKQLTDAYDSEQAELKQQNIVLQAEVDTFDADSVKADRFIDLVKRYTDFTELTAPVINEFVDKILVYEADKSSGKRVQRVDIHFNFIGAFDVPAVEPIPTAEEIEAERKQAEIRAKRREYNQRYQSRRKVKDKVLMPVEQKKERKAETAERNRTAAYSK